MTGTIHSYERAKERLNLSFKKADRIMALALERGKRAEAFKTSDERIFLEDKSQRGSFAVAFDGKCFVFNEYNICITVYLLPYWFAKKKYYEGKERIRKKKNYMRYCGYDYGAYAV